MEEIEALVILIHRLGIGSKKIPALIQAFGSAAAVLRAKDNEISSHLKDGEKTAARLKNWHNQPDWKEDLGLAARHRVSIISYTDADYPARLRELPDFPILLYVNGNLKAVTGHCIAIIGTRQETPYGAEMAKCISNELALAGFTILSGLAIGIDTIAHRAALCPGKTAAVIGSGLAKIYPEENAALADTISRQGAVISEYPMNTPPVRHHFPQRNRIVSGLSQGVVLIEAPESSGAMITMEKARLQGRPRFAIPGRADGATFKGNHLLIKKREAHLVESAQEVIEFYNNPSFGLSSTISREHRS